MRYYIADDNAIPFHEQPAEGYTKLQVIARAQREIDECIKLFGGSFQDYKSWFIILDNKFHDVTKDFINAI